MSPFGAPCLTAYNVVYVIGDAFTWSDVTDRFLRPVLDADPMAFVPVYETEPPITRVWRFVGASFPCFLTMNLRRLRRWSAWLLPALILLVALVLRTCNVDWADGQLPHPDERSTVAFYASTIRWPGSRVPCLTRGARL